MQFVAHNEKLFSLKQVITIYENYIHKALLLVKTCEIQVTQLRTLDFSSIIR